MFKYRKFELIVYFLLIALSLLFSVLLLAAGYPGWFLFATAAVILPCAWLSARIMRTNRALALPEKYLAAGDYENLDQFALKAGEKFPFVKVYRIDSLLERGDAEGFLQEYAAFYKKGALEKDWRFRLEAYKVFCDALCGAEIGLKTVRRMESEISADEVSRERCIVKVFDYLSKKDFDRAARQIGWYEQAGEKNRFLEFMYEYARCMAELAANGSAEESEKILLSAAYNDFLKTAAAGWKETAVRLIGEFPEKREEPPAIDGENA